MALKTKNRYFRADVSRGLINDRGVDRGKDTIHGFAVISLGMAKGHNMEIDGTALDQVVALGNKHKKGVKARFGHPNMSSEALGTFLGRSKNFRRHGPIVRADLHLDQSAHETPNGDLADYVLSLAESDPESFGASIVFSGEEELRVDDKGKRLLDDDGNELPPLARIETLAATDVVDEPAANESGFFGHQFFNDDVKLSAEATAFLRKFLDMPDSVEKVIKFLTRYSSNEEGENIMPTQTVIRSENEGGDESKTQQPTKQGGDELSKIDENKVKESFDSGKLQGAEAERKRIQDVEAQSIPGHEALIAGLKFDGKTTGPEAAVEVLKAEKSLRATTANNIIKDSGAPVHAVEPDTASATPDANLPINERAKKEWDSKPEIRDEFFSLESYTAFLEAEDRGCVKILKG